MNGSGCNFALMMQWYPGILKEGEPYRVEGGYVLFQMCGPSGSVKHDFTLGRHGMHEGTKKKILLLQDGQSIFLLCAKRRVPSIRFSPLIES